MKKNRLIMLLLVLFAGGLIFWACQREEVDIPLDNTGNSELSSMLKGIYLPNVRKAIQWYSEHWQYTPLGRGMTGEHPLFKNMVPMWHCACAYRKGDREVVEVPLRAESYRVFTLPENAIAYDETKDNRYINSLTRLVILTDKKTCKTKGFFMTQTPTKEYMDAKKFDVYRSVYLYRQEDFDGYIYFHYLDGTFANGWRYSDGRITHMVRSATPEEKASVLSSRAEGYYDVKINCYPIYNVVVSGYYETNEHGEQVFVEVYRYEEYVGEHCETEVIWIPGEPGESDPGDPGSGGIVDPEDKCPYGTRGCPGGNNCTCCRICEGPCIVVPCPICGMRHCTAVHIDCDKADDQCKATTNELLDDINFATPFGEGTITYKDFLSRFAAEPTLEHSVSLNKEWDVNQNKQVSTLAFYHQGTPENVPMEYSNLTHAVIHTHPISTNPGYINILPPSAKDVCNLLEVVVKEEVKSDGTRGYAFPNLKTSYVVAKDYTFAITVTDRKKAAVFLENNPNFVGSDAGFVRGTDVGKRYYDGQVKLGKMYSGVEVDIYSLAYALQRADAGVQLLYKKNGEQVFTLVKTMDASSEIIAVFHCK